MPWTDSQQNSGFWDIRAVGPVAQTAPVIATPPSTIAASGQWQSAVLPADGFKTLAVGVTSSQTGAVNVQRYLDAAGTVTQGAASTQALTAATAAVLNVTDGVPFASFQITVTNTGASTATISKFAVLLNAQ